MRTLVIIIIVAFCVIYRHEISNFVSGNAPEVDATITKWFIDHTPPKAK